MAIKYTKWGYQVRVIGESPAAARYAGMNIPQNICLVMFLSGSLAGLAGMSEVSGIAGQTAARPESRLWLYRDHRRLAGPAPSRPSWLWSPSFFGGLLVGGYASQLVGLRAATVNMIQGAILFFILGAQILTGYDLKLVRQKKIRPAQGGGLMDNIFWVTMSATAITAGTPILFAALGELVTEKSGVLNLGV